MEYIENDFLNLMYQNERNSKKSYLQQRLKKNHGYRLVPQTIELAQSIKNPTLRIAA
jgi:hypothetical protein